ncbi:hypothetical protein BH18ACT14_BH18ACT14_19310 [soil metagenome]
MFDVLIDVCGRDRWDGDPDPRYSFHPLDDVPFIADAEMIHIVGERIASLVREGKHVALNCLSGVNRSGLLVACALVVLGYTPEEAIEAVRSARGQWRSATSTSFGSSSSTALLTPWHDADSCHFRSDSLDVSRSGRRPAQGAWHRVGHD